MSKTLRGIVAGEIRMNRKARNLTQKELGERISTGQQQISDWECMQSSITIDKLEDLAEAFNATPKFFFDPQDLDELPDDFPVWLHTSMPAREVKSINRVAFFHGETTNEFIRNAVRTWVGSYRSRFDKPDDTPSAGNTWTTNKPAQTPDTTKTLWMYESQSDYLSTEATNV